MTSVKIADINGIIQMRSCQEVKEKKDTFF